MSTSSPRPPRSPRSTTGNTGTVLIVVVVVVAVVVGFAAIALSVRNSPASGAATGTHTSPTSPAPSTPVTSPTSSGPTSLPPLHCLPAPPKPAKPAQYPKAPSPGLAQHATWRATVTTNCGVIVMDLDGKLAPQTVASFIFLSQKKFFDDSPCHRLTLASQGLSVLQCGDPTGTGTGGPGYGYGIENAPPTGDYPAGTVAMARTQDPNSNGSQFFIVYADTTLPTQGGGYSIFGKVVRGLSIVKAIAARGLASDQQSPAQPISILKVTVSKL